MAYRASAAFTGVLLAILASGQARAANAWSNAKVESVEPSGFSDLTGRQETIVDIYYGGSRVGDARISFEPGSITFNNPEAVVKLLPELTDPSVILSVLSAPHLPSNAQLVCTAGSDPASCGRMEPESAAVIFDQDHFRVDIFINRRFLTARTIETRQYLPRPQSGLSFVSSLAAVVAGSNEEDPTYNLQDQLIVGDADRRLRADVAYASGFGVQADQLTVEIDKPGWRYSAGAFWAPGTDLVGRRKMIGLGIRTQIDTRIDKDDYQSSPLVVFLNQRARVDILRDGRVLVSRIYEAGNQQLDTSGMPNGSYEVVLRIEEAGGDRREERRFFTKDPSIPRLGQKIFFAYAGVLADDLGKNFISPTSTPFLESGAAFRLNSRFAVDGTVLMTDGAGVAEIGTYYLSKAVKIRVAAIGTTTSSYGGLIDVSSPGSGRFNFGFDLRRIVVTGNGNNPSTQQEMDWQSGEDPSLLSLARNTFTQLAGNITYNLPRVQFSLAGTYRLERNQGATYNFGPSLRWEVLRRGPMRLTFTSDFAVTDHGHSGFVGLTLQLLGRHSLVDGGFGLRSSRAEDGREHTVPVGALHGAWQDDDFSGGQLNLSASYEHDNDRDQAGASVELRGSKVALGGDVVNEFGGNGMRTQYGINFQTMIAGSGRDIAFSGRQKNDSMVIVKVDDKEPANRFEVLVNESPAGMVRGGETLALPLVPYHQYAVRLRQADGKLAQIDNQTRPVALYPGNVAELAWTARSVTAMFGRLLLEDGEPVRQAAIVNPGGIGQTDDNGYFQIEATDGTELEVRLASGKTCRAKPPVVNRVNDYAQLGTLTCRMSKRVASVSFSN